MINFSRHCTMTFSGYCMLKNIKKRRFKFSCVFQTFVSHCVVKIGCLICPEAVVPRCYSFQVFLKISQNLQENACSGVSFNKVAGLQPGTLFKKKLSRVFPCEFSGIFKRTLFTDIFGRLLLSVIFYLGSELLRKTL